MRCHGKGRKHRITPLTRPTAAALRAWLRRTRRRTRRRVFPTRPGRQLTRDAVGALVAKHAATATHRLPRPHRKNITPHTLRTPPRWRLLHAGVDTTVIALWLGHEQTDTTLIYLHADLTIKQKALDRVQPAGSNPGRYRPPDAVLAFLDSL